ncbi:MAG: serine hydroxymethyltransferase [Tenericutes bacterium GWC2_34_14]|nr:MAG: serine hydroxymethyltransferase [Tenericutes bacterium GWA2_35_7]OHE28046.1 MAG: serine hydroxymethyltransferase [Tenericutes bacterium GWC2_34_14]OHE33013.1 MAG: serine hydroxymethyltransferase [Tenericutes bacterium GWE2_34_108]OHE36021.1 MAG: serine hydroxymethyltransferase [Tenericutes bacterium GWF1_35_14]OHE39244.1 MAG: serine hydroxymethyltransferase [Tenericutes bacterium GWF2_35_184]OHE44519.1 MAG: serine hydroxymethyltransferase [Tenericutes bacterium RIFOXYA2_FULL_36_32]OHE
MGLYDTDPIIDAIILKEKNRQEEHIELIASENFVSQAVLDAQGSILTNKYAEGYPKKRYYGGCEFVDEIESLAIERLKALFQVKYANVQPHSGSQANMAVYMALMNPGDRLLGMSLAEGGHLTHGFNLNFSGKLYQSFFYGVDEKTECIDYDRVLEIALEVKPKVIVAGASAYSRIIDFKRFREIADAVGAYLHVDMAHIAGLVAAGVHPSPFPYAHVVSSTTHKTLRGPRGGIILTNDEDIAKKIDKTVFPGIQGGPLMHVIAAKAVAFNEALNPDFIEYQKQVVKNAHVLSSELISFGYRVVSGGTDNHLMLVDVKSKHQMTGLDAERLLHKVSITCNKNGVPFDKEKPAYASGIRLGTPAVTTRGFKEDDMKLVAKWIDQALIHRNEPEKLLEIKEQVISLTKKYPLYRKGV